MRKPRSSDPGPTSSALYQWDPLDQLLIDSLYELPISTQLMLFRQLPVKPPFLFVGKDGPVSRAGLLDHGKWFSNNKDDLAIGLLRYHGLDPDRIALLYELGAMGVTPRIVSAKLKFTFTENAKNVTPGPASFSLHEAAIATALLVEFDVAFRMAFEPLGLTAVDPRVELAAGSLTAVLSSSAAGLGLLLLLDVVSGGATVPITAPLYAKAILGGALLFPPSVNFATEQRKKWLEGTEAGARAKKEMAEAKKAEEEARTHKDKTQWVIEKIKAETIRTYTEIAEKLAEAPSRRVPPPSADVPLKTIQDMASQNQVSVQTAIVAINTGFPLLAEAESVGIAISKAA